MEPRVIVPMGRRIHGSMCYDLSNHEIEIDEFTIHVHEKMIYQSNKDIVFNLLVIGSTNLVLPFCGCS